jgi:topoisomerase-4 subunit B
VEGDSAGGSAKQARDKNFQAIMPIRGKILNTWEVSSDEVLASQEVHNIAIAIGVDPGSDDLSELRYGKICILADADSDGLHIATLLCALFVKHFPILVEEDICMWRCHRCIELMMQKMCTMPWTMTSLKAC